MELIKNNRIILVMLLLLLAALVFIFQIAPESNSQNPSNELNYSFENLGQKENHAEQKGELATLSAKELNERASAIILDADNLITANPLPKKEWSTEQKQQLNEAVTRLEQRILEIEKNVNQ